jgi:hypothetical protein
MKTNSSPPFHLDIPTKNIVRSIFDVDAICHGSATFYGKASFEVRENKLRDKFATIYRTTSDQPELNKDQIESLLNTARLLPSHPLADWYYSTLKRLSKKSTDSLLRDLYQHEMQVMLVIRDFTKDQLNPDMIELVADILAKTQLRVESIENLCNKRKVNLNTIRFNNAFH